MKFKKRMERAFLFLFCFPLYNYFHRAHEKWQCFISRQEKQENYRIYPETLEWRKVAQELSLCQSVYTPAAHQLIFSFFKKHLLHKSFREVKIEVATNSKHTNFYIMKTSYLFVTHNLPLYRSPLRHWQPGVCFPSHNLCSFENVI